MVAAPIRLKTGRCPRHALLIGRLSSRILLVVLSDRLWPHSDSGHGAFLTTLVAHTARRPTLRRVIEERPARAAPPNLGGIAKGKPQDPRRPSTACSVLVRSAAASDHAVRSNALQTNELVAATFDPPFAEAT